MTTNNGFQATPRSISNKTKQCPFRILAGRRGNVLSRKDSLWLFSVGDPVGLLVGDAVGDDVGMDVVGAPLG